MVPDGARPHPKPDAVDGGANSHADPNTAAKPTAMAAGRTHYELLGVGAGATRGEIKAAYQRLAREVHPDAAGGGDDEGFIRLHTAYAMLADPDERARYDRDVACHAAGMMMRWAAVAGPVFRRRTWVAGLVFRRRTLEADQCW